MGHRVIFSITMLIGLLVAVQVEAASPVISAGVDKTFALPQHEYTLFGTATDADGDVLTVTWSLVSGPAGSTFSAPWALATTFAVTQTGTYTVRLTVFDGTNTVTDDAVITVNSAASQTAFYVDPTYTGGSNDGSPEHPWTSLGGSGSTPWNTINSALASNHVIVYYSARIVGSDTSEVSTTQQNLWRTDTSTYRLTIDGMSKWNTNDTSGSWADYTGTNKFHFAITSGSLGIGVESTQGTTPMNYTTLRGFESSGCSGRVGWVGDQVTLEYLWVHDVSCTGPNTLLMEGHEPFGNGCTTSFGQRGDMTLRGSVIENSEGEGIYLGSNYRTSDEGGCLSVNDGHHDILIEGNSVTAPGTGGGESDGIDLKATLVRVTLRGNTVTDATNYCVTTLGAFDTAAGERTDYLFENNHCINTLGIVLFNDRGSIIRNNVLVNGNLGTTGTGSGPAINFQMGFYNNTIYRNTAGISGIGLSNVDIVDVKNNLIWVPTGTLKMSRSISSNVTTDYNIFSDNVTYDPWTGEGAHSLTIAAATAQFVAPASNDFRLLSTSDARDSGVSVPGMSRDSVGTLRPQGDAWDIGAYEYISAIAVAPFISGSMLLGR